MTEYGIEGPFKAALCATASTLYQTDSFKLYLNIFNRELISIFVPKIDEERVHSVTV
jgi:NADPH-dependent 7-cyano-7-deazaguanine reductase QueF-like protein